MAEGDFSLRRINFPPVRKTGSIIHRRFMQMVKGISRRVVVVDSPDQRFFEQAIFILRSDAAGEGVSARQLVDEARQVARNYGGGGRGRFSRLWGDLNPAVYTLMGAGATGLLWMIAALG
jgi:hypothetical protein